MTIDPTLGVRPFNPEPLINFGNHQSQALQQLGAQLRQDLTTIQTNRQLKDFGASLQGLDPQSAEFPVRITEAITNYPLAAHSPVGTLAIQQLGSAHKSWIQEQIAQQRAGEWKALTGTGGSLLYNPQTGETQGTGYVAPEKPQRPVIVSNRGVPVGVLNPNNGIDRFDPQDVTVPGVEGANDGTKFFHVGTDIVGVNKKGETKTVYQGGGSGRRINAAEEKILQDKQTDLHAAADELDQVSTELANTKPGMFNSGKIETLRQKQAQAQKRLERAQAAFQQANTDLRSPLSKVGAAAAAPVIPGMPESMPTAAPADGSALMPDAPPAVRPSPKAIADRVKAAGGTKEDLVKALRDAGYAY